MSSHFCCDCDFKGLAFGVLDGIRDFTFRGCGAFDPPSVGGVYPAAARARCIIASISSFVFVDFGMGTNGIFILVTGNGACPFALGVEPGGNAFGGMVDAWLFPGGTTFGGGGGCFHHHQLSLRNFFVKNVKKGSR